MLKEFSYIFDRKQKIGLVLLLFAIFLGTFLELMGVTAIMPFIDVVMDPRSIQKKWYLKFIYDTFGFQRDTDFIIFVAVALIVVYVYDDKNTAVLNMQLTSWLLLSFYYHR